MMRLPIVTLATHTKFPLSPVDIFGTKTEIYQINYRKLFNKLFIPNYIVRKIIKKSKYILNSDSFFQCKVSSAGEAFWKISPLTYEYELYCKYVENVDEVAARV